MTSQSPKLSEAAEPRLKIDERILKYGAPRSLAPATLCYANHCLGYDPQRRTPAWVSEHITRDHVSPPKDQVNKAKAPGSLNQTNHAENSHLVLVS